MKTTAAIVYLHQASGKCGKLSHLATQKEQNTNSVRMPNKNMTAMGVSMAGRFLSPVATLFIPRAHLYHIVIFTTLSIFYRSLCSIDLFNDCVQSVSLRARAWRRSGNLIPAPASVLLLRSPRGCAPRDDIKVISFFRLTAE